MTLQELLDMPLLSSISDCSGRIVRVPGGWLFDRCFVPQPVEPEIIQVDIKTAQRFDQVQMKEAFKMAFEFADNGENNYQDTKGYIQFKERFNIDL